jgi:fucose permease
LTGDRIPTIPLAIGAVLVMSVALAGALVVPDPTAAIGLFGLVGFASGPVYPLIMSAAGERFPNRSAVVAGSLAGVAVLGGVIYPPLVGLLADRVGIRGGMVGAVALGLVCAGAVFVAARAREDGAMGVSRPPDRSISGPRARPPIDR